MSEADAAALVGEVQRTYRSLSEPSYLFVEEALAARPYAELVDRLSQVVDMDETTDPNDDVSFRYVLTRGEDAWGLNLSMVGPYGLLMRLSGGRPRDVITGRSSAESTREGKLLELIEDAGICLLSQEILAREIPLRRPSADDEQTLVYHALIGDEPMLPWQADD